MSGCLLYALLSNYVEALGWPPSNWPQPDPLAAIEIVDLDSLRTVKSFEIGARKPTALELVGGRLYVVDPSHNEVVVLAGSGPPGETLSVSPAPSDCVAAPDGSRVYVAGSEAIDVIDTSSLLVERVPHKGFAASGVAISDDGGTVVAVGEQLGTGVALVLDTATLSAREVHLAGSTGAVDAAFFKRDVALVWTGSSFMQVDTSSATQIPGATVPTPGWGLRIISTLQFSSPASRAFTVDYINESISGFIVPFGKLESLDPSTGRVSTVAGLGLPPYVMRLAPTGDKLCLVQGHEFINTGGGDALSVFDVHAGTSAQGAYLFSERDLFVTDMRLHCPTGIPGWHWAPWPWPVPKRPVRGSGEGVWFFVDPLWDPRYGLAANVGLGLGGRLGRGIARVIDNWRQRFSSREEPG